MSHTKGVLFATYSDKRRPDKKDVVFELNGGVVCQLHDGYRYHKTELVTGNAERIAACWNACQGIPTQRLADVGTGYVENLEQIIEQQKAYIGQLQGLLLRAEPILKDVAALVSKK